MTTAVGKRMWGSLAALASVGAILGLAVTGSSQSASTLVSQLQRPAAFPAISVGPGPVDHMLRSGPWVLRLRLEPNRANVHDQVALVLTRRNRGIKAAVTVTYSMPSMNMWDGLHTSLTSAGPGRYVAGEPVLGMPGDWQLRIAVAPRGARAFTVVVNDRMNP